MSTDNIPDILKQKNEAIKLLDKSKNIIRYLALFSASVFAWLNVRELPISSLANDLSTELILKLSLLILFLAWVYGSTLDATDSSTVIHKAKNKGEVPFLGIAIAVITWILFLSMCYFYNSAKLPILLFIFWTYNFFAWKLLNKKVVQPYFDLNRKFFKQQGNYLMLKQFEIVVDFVYGKWNFNRFICGSVYLVIIIISSATNSIDFIFPDPNKKSFYISLLILVFVIMTELWAWYYRLKKSFSIKTITEILEKEK